jgi:hypothetical protein
VHLNTCFLPGICNLNVFYTLGWIAEGEFACNLRRIGGAGRLSLPMRLAGWLADAPPFPHIRGESGQKAYAIRTVPIRKSPKGYSPMAI